MTPKEFIDGQLDHLRRLKSGWQRMLTVLQSPGPWGRLVTNGVWETTEEAIKRVKGWIDREDQTFPASGIPVLVSRFTSLRLCCSTDSVQHIR